MTFDAYPDTTRHTALRAVEPTAGPRAGAGDRVFVLIVTYTAALAAVDAMMPAHRRFLDAHFATGEFLASGPQDPRTGGIILARVVDRGRVEQLIAADPFTRNGLATYQVHAFTPTRGPFALPLRDPAVSLPSRSSLATSPPGRPTTTP